MDHSFVGMKGGEIFHEMMLRQGVKHICMTHPPDIESSIHVLIVMQSGILEELSYLYSMLSTTPSISTSFFLDMNKELVTWQKVMPERQESQESSL